MTSTTLTTSQHPAEQHMYAGMFYTSHIAAAACARTHSRACPRGHYIFRCSCTHSKLYLQFVFCTAPCTAVEKNYSSRSTFVCQSAVSQAKRALGGTIAECECNSFSSFLAVCIAGEWRGSGGAGHTDTMKPPRSQRSRMLTVLAWSYVRRVWLSLPCMHVRMWECMCVSLHVTMATCV